jgi:hypothetical protein
LAIPPILFGWVVHPDSDPRIEFRVTQITNGFLSIEALALGFSDYFTRNNHANFPDALQFWVQTASVDLISVDCCAECYS